MINASWHVCHMDSFWRNVPALASAAKAIAIAIAIWRNTRQADDAGEEVKEDGYDDDDDGDGDGDGDRSRKRQRRQK